MKDTGNWELDTGYWILETRFWLLETGYWYMLLANFAGLARGDFDHDQDHDQDHDDFSFFLLPSYFFL